MSVEMYAQGLQHADQAQSIQYSRGSIRRSSEQLCKGVLARGQDHRDACKSWMTIVLSRACDCSMHAWLAYQQAEEEHARHAEGQP